MQKQCTRSARAELIFPAHAVQVSPWRTEPSLIARRPAPPGMAGMQVLLDTLCSATKSKEEIGQIPSAGYSTILIMVDELQLPHVVKSRRAPGLAALVSGGTLDGPVESRDGMT